MTGFMDVANFKKLPILGILRGIELGIIESLVEEIISTGLETIEITMNTKAASDLIRQAVKIAQKRLCVGAGTVLNMDSLKMALDAGATFIVMPVLVDDVMQYCKKNNIPAFPGALSPQEIYKAWDSGATMVKVFPAKFFGAEYFKEVKAPFNDIELLACGGVTPENMQDFFDSGASAISFGASVFRQEWLKARNFASIKQSISRYVNGFSIKTERVK